MALKTPQRPQQKRPQQLRIAAVSYLNTVPLIYGIRSAAGFDVDVLLAPPADCTRAFVQRQADIALVPAAAVPGLEDAKIITDYCIGASGPVRTVALLSNSPLDRIHRIYLDPHSQTSAQLVRYLAANRWKIDPEWVPYAAQIPAEGEAVLLIGDKVFAAEKKYRYSWDLADEWQRQTGLPFAFALWVAREDVPEQVVEKLEHALTEGIERTWEAIQQADVEIDPVEAYTYLTRHIDYLLDADKRLALDRFWAGIKPKRP